MFDFDEADPRFQAAILSRLDEALDAVDEREYMEAIAATRAAAERCYRDFGGRLSPEFVAANQRLRQAVAHRRLKSPAAIERVHCALVNLERYCAGMEAAPQ